MPHQPHSPLQSRPLPGSGRRRRAGCARGQGWALGDG